MAWQSNVGGGWPNDHTSHWDHGTPPQRNHHLAEVRDDEAEAWHGKRRPERTVEAVSAAATQAQGRVMPLTPSRAFDARSSLGSTKRQGWAWEMPLTHWEAGAVAPKPPFTPRQGAAAAAQAPAIVYDVHPWGYNTLETAQIRSDRQCATPARAASRATMCSAFLRRLTLRRNRQGRGLSRDADAAPLRAARCRRRLLPRRQRRRTRGAARRDQLAPAAARGRAQRAATAGAAAGDGRLTHALRPAHPAARWRRVGGRQRRGREHRPLAAAGARRGPVGEPGAAAAALPKPAAGSAERAQRQVLEEGRAPTETTAGAAQLQGEGPALPAPPEHVQRSEAQLPSAGDGCD